MPRLTIPAIRAFKGVRKLVMLTAYDAPSAKLADDVADIILVGDSVGTTVQGREDTLSVTMDQMIYHSRLVTEHSTKALVVGDMPFLSYQLGAGSALANAGRFLKEGRVNAVKLEGGASVAATVQALVEAGIPVMGHIGFTPQSVNVTGVSVNRNEAQLLEEAKLLEAAGAFSLVLEMVPADVAKTISQALTIPTIGIGGGPNCDGQVLVFHDVLGFNPDFNPKFLKKYLDFHGEAKAALMRFREEVIAGSFPAAEHCYRTKPTAEQAKTPAAEQASKPKKGRK